MNKRYFFLLAAIISFGAGNPIYGAEWTGSSSSFWTNSANWSSGSVPASSQSLVVQFPGSSPNAPILNDSITLQGIEVVPPAGTLAGLLISGDPITFADFEPFIRNTSLRFVTFTNPMIIPADNLKITSSSIWLNGPISGPGGLNIEISNFSSFYLQPIANNTYQGLTRIGGRATVQVSGASIAIPGDVEMTNLSRLVLLGENVIAADAMVTLSDAAWFQAAGGNFNQISQIVDGENTQVIISGGSGLTLLSDNPTDFVGRFAVGGHFVKTSDAPLMLRGTVSGSGIIEANSHFFGIFEPQPNDLPILIWKGGLTIHNESRFIVTPSAFLNRPFMRIQNGTLSVKEDATVTIELRDDGAFGSGEFALWEWDEHTQIPPNLDQFIINGIPDGFRAELIIVESVLFLIVSGPRLNLRTHLTRNHKGKLQMKVSNAIEGVRYLLEMSRTLKLDSWQEVDHFDGWDFLYEFPNGIDLSQYLIYAEGDPSVFFRLRVDL